ncbi:MAG TPA: prepilin-type N-terminal cleavage/methylation domain-containing protein [Chthoniobacteraceae bacterium]|nr:prepilin-type N-terminal cleavage/methylation domain-containing protein [Chthoniobacteraceae bacterium]
MKIRRYLRIPRRRLVRNPGFTVMELLVTLAVVLVLAAIAVPVYRIVQQRANKQAAMKQMKELGGGVSVYVGQNDGSLPAEDSTGNDSWKNTAKPEAEHAWYNALPRVIGRKGVGDYASSPREFYTKSNILYVPGAEYPESDKIMRDPLFAIAFNTKLQRRDAEGKKKRTKMSEVVNPSRTVVLLEQGLPNETKTLEVQTKKDYDGSCKGSAKSFVGRYGGQGVLFFLDGHAEFVSVRDTLTETGNFPFPQTNVIWTCGPDENPNKTSTGLNPTK